MIRILFFLFLITSGLSGQSAGEVSVGHVEFKAEIENYLSHTIPIISVQDALLSKDDFVFLDTREKEEYNISHIPDAIHVGYDHFDKSKLQKVDKDTPIIVYCSIGYRSEKVGEILQKMGYTRVQNLYGSIFEWANCNYPLRDSEGNNATAIHTYNKYWSKWVTTTQLDRTW